MAQKRAAQWIVAFKAPKGKSEVVRMPGGLHETEAIHGATRTSSKNSVFVRAYRDDATAVLAMR